MRDENLFAISLDSEHIFCYSMKHRKEQTFKREGKESRPMRKTNKKYRIKSKFRFIAFVVVVLGIAVGAFGFINGSVESIALEQPQDQVVVEVAAGDTIWDIADQYKSDGKDIRKAVYEICQVNDIPDGKIQSGMKLAIPEYL